MSLKITFSKPNPIGKDKTPIGTSKPEQLLGEWVDITNVGNEPIRFSTMGLHHTRFNEHCQTLTEPTERYWSCGGTESLKVGQTLRVYTGRKRDQHLLESRPLDKGTVDWRGFADLERFVLNNKCGDTIYVTWRNSQGTAIQDKASYSNNPPEGIVLKRVGEKLEPVASYSYR
jgi:hypothetical protein